MGHRLQNHAEASTHQHGAIASAINWRRYRTAIGGHRLRKRSALGDALAEGVREAVAPRRDGLVEVEVDER